MWVSPSTLYRVLAGEGLVLPARPQRTPVPARPLGDWIEWRRHQIWIYDITHFPRAGRVAYAILDVVTRKWLATLVTAEETATQVEVVFTEALDSEGLWPAVEARQADRARRGDDSDEEPILLAMSDNGPQMRAGTTREFLAMCCIAARFGRPGTPTDQAWIETLFGHVKTEWPHLEKITDPNMLRAELDNARGDYNTRRLHASLGYVTPDDEHQGRGDTIRQARQDGLNRARLTRIAYHRNNKPKPAMNTPAQCGVIKPPKTDIYSEAPHLALQHREHRLRRQPLTHEPRPLEQISLTRLHTHRHSTNLPARPNNIRVILPHQPTRSPPQPTEKHQPPRWPSPFASASVTAVAPAAARCVAIAARRSGSCRSGWSARIAAPT